MAISDILNSSREIKKEFLRSFFDDEGSVVKQGNHGIIRLYSINLEGLRQIQKMLNEFEINSKIDAGFGLKRNVFAIVIKDLTQFHKKIGFNLKRKQEKLEGLVY